MAHKFKVGDIVEAVKYTGKHSGPLPRFFKRGHRGTVTEYTGDIAYPYVVRRKNGMEYYFNARELKLIKKK